MRAVKSFDQRMKDAFGGAARAEFGQKYLELLYANWYEVARNVRRMAGLFVGVGVGFLLLVHAKNAQVTLGPLKLTNVAAVQTVLPAVASFLLYEFVAFAVASATYAEAAGSLIHDLYPPVFENDLEILLAPSTSHIWEESNWRFLRTRRASGKPARGLDVMAKASVLVLLLGGLLFLAYAYYELYRNSHANVAAVSLSVAFAVWNVVRSLLEYLDDQN
jgi:hypothetical protein